MSIKDEWLTHPVTKETLRDFEEEALKLQRDLLSAGVHSSDPNISSIAGQLSLLTNIIKSTSETENTDEEENTQ